MFDPLVDKGGMWNGTAGTQERFDLMFELDELCSSFQALAWCLYPSLHLKGFGFSGMLLCYLVPSRLLPTFHCFKTNSRVHKFGKLSTCRSGRK